MKHSRETPHIYAHTEHNPRALINLFTAKQIQKAEECRNVVFGVSARAKLFALFIQPKAKVVFH